MAGFERKRSRGMDWLSFVSFGFFLVLLGTIWIITPNLTDEVRAFVDPKNWQTVNVTEGIRVPEPINGSPVVYTAAMQFCFIFGAFEIVILAIRFGLRESLDRTRGTLSGAVFWFSVGYFLYALVNESLTWFGFLAGLVISVGLAIIVRSLFRLLG